MKCLYIYNPKSGKQNNHKTKEYIISELKTKFEEVNVKPTQKRGDASEFAKQACGNYDVLVVSGGDGTMNEIVSGLANQENRPKIGYIPTGTTNDLAHSLKIPTNIKKAMKIILNGHTIKHDIFKAGEKYGIYVCAFGLFTGSSYTASQKAKKALGKLAYYIDGAKELSKTKKFPIMLKFDRETLGTDIILGIIANSKYVSGYKINKKADCTDGNVNLILFREHKKKGVSLRSLFNIFKSFIFGIKTLKNSRNCIILELNKFSIELEENTIINIDGEQGFKGSFNFKVLPRHIDIFVKSNYKTEFKHIKND